MQAPRVHNEIWKLNDVFCSQKRETIEFVGEYPSRYMWYVYEFYEEYRNEPFETIDIDRFPHLYILRDKKKKNRDKK
ncbi:unnamed protein product [Oikopleura dioica]|uniref:Uncharacterized protein n=1 Tax=Oikopleura dioica TaxID=34765 RepID=E4XVG4_OIKDI|nr:unnamed protein product [Oikopleura dioica]